MTDPPLPKKLNIFQLLDGAEWTDGPKIYFESAPCKVNEISRRTEEYEQALRSAELEPQRTELGPETATAQTLRC